MEAMLTLCSLTLVRSQSVSFRKQTVPTSTIWVENYSKAWLAVVLAIAYTFIKLRRRDRNPPAAFISITATPATDATVKPETDSD